MFETLKTSNLKSMISYKIVLRRKIIRNITSYYLVIRLIWKRRNTEISLKMKINPDDWDYKRIEFKKSCINYLTKNLYLNKQKRKIEVIIDRIRYTEEETCLSKIASEFKGIKKNKSNQTLSDYYKFIIENNPDADLSFGTLQYYKVGLNRWNEKFSKVLLQDLSKDHIIAFKKRLIEVYKNNPTTVHKRLSVLRKVITRAENEGLVKAGIFNKIKSKPQYSEKTPLTIEQVEKLRDLQGLTKVEEFARDIFLFSSNTGLRIGDLCTLKNEHLTHFISGEKTIQRIKKNTEKTKSRIHNSLPDIAIKIIRKYNNSRNDLLFPLLEVSNFSNDEELYKSKSKATSRINNALKRVRRKANIREKISTHVARYTFASLLGSNGTSLLILKELLGHSDVRMTQKYVKIAQNMKDEAVIALNSL